jgi:flagellar biosynthesis/type III secretory pathway M-ring protein FliF/YscJ
VGPPLTSTSVTAASSISKRGRISEGVEGAGFLAGLANFAGAPAGIAIIVVGAVIALLLIVYLVILPIIERHREKARMMRESKTGDVEAPAQPELESGLVHSNIRLMNRAHMIAVPITLAENPFNDPQTQTQK